MSTLWCSSWSRWTSPQSMWEVHCGPRHEEAVLAQVPFCLRPCGLPDWNWPWLRRKFLVEPWLVYSIETEQRGRSRPWCQADRISHTVISGNLDKVSLPRFHESLHEWRTQSGLLFNLESRIRGENKRPRSWESDHAFSSLRTSQTLCTILPWIAYEQQWRFKSNDWRRFDANYSLSNTFTDGWSKCSYEKLSSG